MKLVHRATWWATTPDGFGGDSFAAPVLLDCWWEDKSELFRSGLDRREYVSNSIVVVDRDLSLGDYLYLGEHADLLDPSMVSGANKIQQVSRVTDLRNVSILRQVIL